MSKSPKVCVLYSESFTAFIQFKRLVFSPKYKHWVWIQVSPIAVRKEGKVKKNFLKRLFSASFVYLLINIINYIVYPALARFTGHSIARFAAANATHEKIEQCSDSLRELLAKHQPDWLINDSGMILSARDIDACEGRVLNYHAAPLPAYRGAASNVWFILNGEEQVWGTLHYVVPALDRGDIIFRSPTVEVDVSKSAYSIYLEILTKMPDLVTRFLDEVERGQTPPATAQEVDLARSFSFPSKGDIDALNRKGFRYLKKDDLLLMIRALRHGRIP